MPPHPENREAPSVWRLAPWFLGLLSLAVYWTAQARELIPGTSLRILNSVCGLDPIPITTHRLYALAAGLFVRLAPGSEFHNLNLFSALFAALSLMAVYFLVEQIPYPMPRTTAPGEARARPARRLAALLSTLFLALGVPFWKSATQPGNATFDLFLLLGCFLLVARYALANGRRAYLLWASFLYGLGITEYHTMIVVAPVFALIALLVLLRRGQLNASTLSLMILCGLVGLSFYLASPLQIARYPDYGYGRFEGLTGVLVDAWKNQYQQIRASMPKVGGLLIVLSTFVPWIYVLFMARPSRGLNLVADLSISLSLVMLVGLGTAILLEIPASPYRLLGQTSLLLPYLSLASWMGYLAGFWYLRTSFRASSAEDLFDRFNRALSLLLLIASLCLPAVVAAMNFSRHYRYQPSPVIEYAKNIVRSCESRTLFFSNVPLLDEILSQLARQNRSGLEIVSLGLLNQPFYRNYLAHRYLKQAQPLDPGLPSLDLVRRLIQDYPGGLDACAFLLPEMVSSLGLYFVPNGLVVGAVNNYNSVPPQDLYARNLQLFEGGFSNQLAQLQSSEPTNGASALLQQDYSRCAKNLGVTQRLLNTDALAERAFALALRLCPNNPSALLNLRQLCLERSTAAAADPAQAEAASDQARALLERAHRVAEQLGPTYIDASTMASFFGYMYSEQIFLVLADQYRRLGLPTMEQTAVEQARMIAPDSVAVSQGIARSLLGRGDLEQAQAEFEKVLGKDASSTDARIGLAAIAQTRNDLPRAIRLLSEPPTRSQDLPVMSLLSLLYLEAGQPDLARPLFEQAVDAKTKDAQSLSFLAMAAFRLALPDLAREYAEKALSQVGNNPELLHILYVLAREDGEYSRALSYLNILRQTFPDDKSILEDVVYLNLRINKLEEATRNARLLLELEPDNLVANMALADIASFDKAWITQEKYLRRAAINKTHPNYAFVLNNLAYCLVKQGRFEEARPLAEEAVTLKPDQDKFHHTLAAALLGLNRYPEAEEQILLAVTLAPSESNHTLLHAEIMLAQGERQKARDLAIKALPGLQGEWRQRGQKLLDQLGG